MARLDDLTARLDARVDPTGKAKKGFVRNVAALRGAIAALKRPKPQHSAETALPDTSENPASPRAWGKGLTPPA